MTPWVLVRMPGDEPAEWIRAHEGPSGGEAASGIALFRVLIEADGEVLGSLWSRRDGEPGLPGRGATRSLSLAADQLGLALRRERLAEVATTAEIARRSDALKSALLDSVSHDLRTPLATIRALAGGLLDEGVPLSPVESASRPRRSTSEALRLSDIVRGPARPEPDRGRRAEAGPGPARARRAGRYGPPALPDGGRARTRSQVEIPEDLPVLVDALFFDQALTNVYDNALAHSASDSVVRLRAQRTEPLGSSAAGAAEIRAPSVELVVEDSGPGLIRPVLEQVFDKFYRGQGVEIGSRHGLGIGLTIARGLTEAMGAQIEAGAGELGGLAITFRLAGSR